MTELKDKSEMKKENPSHSFTEGHQLSEEEKKPFLTEEDAHNAAMILPGGRGEDCDTWIKGFNAAAEKANAKIAEIEKRYNDLSGALRFKYGEWENLKAENEQLEKRLTELEKERDELQSWKDAEIEIWGPVINFCRDNSEELGIPLGARVSRWVISILEQFKQQIKNKMDYMIPKSTHHLEKVISELRVDKAYLEKRLAEAEKERDEFTTVLSKYLYDQGYLINAAIKEKIMKYIEQFKQQKK